MQETSQTGQSRETDNALADGPATIPLLRRKQCGRLDGTAAGRRKLARPGEPEDNDMDDTPTLAQLLPAYRRHLESLCYADTTIHRYAYEAECFCEFSWRHGRIWPGTIRAPDLEAWQQALADSEQRVLSTIVTRMRGLRAFFSYLACPFGECV